MNRKKVVFGYQNPNPYFQQTDDYNISFIQADIILCRERADLTSGIFINIIINFYRRNEHE